MTSGNGEGRRVSVTKAAQVDTSSERTPGGAEPPTVPPTWVPVGAGDGLADGAVPPGYEVLRENRDSPASARFLLGGIRFRQRVVCLKSSLRGELLAAGVGDPAALATGPLFAGPIDGGRTRHALVRTAVGDAWVVKTYRRGGVLGAWNPERYWGCERFLDELRVAAAAGRRGVATAEVLALVMEPAGWGSSRAWIVTRYLPDVRPLHEYFGDPDARRVLDSAGRAVARMHEAGIDHLDLHTGNIVCAVGPDGAKAYVLDWDRARCRTAGTWNPHGNLARLWRSVVKGRKRGLYGSATRETAHEPAFSALLVAFVRGYFAGRPVASLRAAREYVGRRAFWFELRTLFWRSRK